MTYLATAPTLALGVVILVSVALAETKLDSLAIAGRCCPAEAASCCAVTVENRCVYCMIGKPSTISPNPEGWEAWLAWAGHPNQEPGAGFIND
ncbi:unnamed protein product [Heligmosomoides polygyrus]|uniref:Secreted protein n=1 Tax=Heligmosomoides polygyrus TaxID=6339 RepID=A0A183F7T8_HELPZ|nr:unnamed protein product [Heligmosomoides polygyrus]